MENETERSKLADSFSKLQFQPLPAEVKEQPAPRRGLNYSARTDGVPTANIPELQGIPQEAAQPSKEQVMQKALLQAASEFLERDREQIVTRALEIIKGE